MITRKITQTEIRMAQECYLLQSKTFIEILSQLHQKLILDINLYNKEVKISYEETREMTLIRKYINELAVKIQNDLEKGSFL